MNKNKLSNGVVRVSLPATIAADIGSLKEAVGTILDKLGCPACCSGHDIFFELQHKVMFEKMDSRPQPALSDQIPLSNFDTGKNTVHARIQPKFMNKIDRVYDAIDRIAKISGHPACATGCDMFLQMERTLVMDEAFNIKEQVMNFG